MRFTKSPWIIALTLILTAALGAEVGWKMHTLIRTSCPPDINTAADETPIETTAKWIILNTPVSPTPADASIVNTSTDIVAYGTQSDFRDHYKNIWKEPRNTVALSLNFSPYYLPGSDPETDSPVSEEAIRAALDAIVPFTDTIRTFGVSGEMSKFYPIARECGFRVYAGCWIGAGYRQEDVREELTALADIGNRGLADILVVGSEGLLRGDYDASTLIGWINTLRGMLTRDVPIGVSDAASALLGYPEVIAAADVAMFTFYPFFNSTPVESAEAEFESVYRLLQKAAVSAGHTKLICSETGWKFEGKSMGRAVPSPENATRYLEAIYEFSRKEGLEVNLFEAVEEGWKAKHGDAGWGLLDENLEPRPAIRGMLERISEQWRDEKQ